MTERELLILKMQAPSTQKCMLRPDSEDRQWLNRDVSESAVAVPDAKTWEEAVGARPLTLQETKAEAKLRYNRGRHIAVMRNDDEPVTSVTPEKKENAIAAFMRVGIETIAEISGLKRFFSKPESRHEKLMKQLDASEARLNAQQKRIDALIEAKIERDIEKMGRDL